MDRLLSSHSFQEHLYLLLQLIVFHFKLLNFYMDLFSLNQIIHYKTLFLNLLSFYFQIFDFFHAYISDLNHYEQISMNHR